MSSIRPHYGRCWNQKCPRLWRFLCTRFKYCDLFTLFYLKIFSVMVSTLACHAGVPGSIPAKVTSCLYFYWNFWKCTFLIWSPGIREPFFPKLRKKFAAPPKSITNDVYFTVLEGNIHFMSNKLVRAHFHFYIIYKLKNEMVHIINCLDSSVGRAIGSDPEG